ncbi:hypothetical protein GcM1_159010 [Golovinomyces cichoracearum]|uniref:Uncharacterized protein n=1 Tax=Golovinomyces cichoracearum TaxID=62708 RepID=A0A420J9J0_9PEZI|nr:hypothetical protein GcM1_159010 [Golovinomyces cichoracearum]
MIVVVFACALACTSQGSPLAKWKKLLLIYTNVMIPSIIESLPLGMIKSTRIPMTTLTTLRQILVKFNEEDKPNDYRIAPDALDNFWIGGDNPSPQPIIACHNITFCRGERILYAHFSLVVFLAGKLIDDLNRTAITVARPKALIEKYKLSSVEILNGNARMSDHAHQFIHHNTKRYHLRSK